MSIVVRVKPTKVTVNTTAVQGLFEPGGQIGRHGRRVGRNIKFEAERAAAGFARTGDLTRSHVGPYYSMTYMGGHVTVGNTAGHARYVHEGTTGPIFPRNPTGMLWLRPAPSSHFAYDPDWPGGRTPLPHVKGQSANPWMAEAMRLVVRLTYI